MQAEYCIMDFSHFVTLAQEYMYKVEYPTPWRRWNRIKGFNGGEDIQSGRTIKQRRRGKINSKMFKLKRKERGVGIWNKYAECLSVRRSDQGK